MELKSAIEPGGLLEETGTISSQLDNTIAAFSREQFNITPFEGSWSAGQVAEHILKSVSAIGKALNGRVTDCHRAPDERVNQFAAVFLDYNIKMKSPAFIIPSQGPHQKKELSTNLDRSFKKILTDNKKHDLSKICLDFEMPGIGNLTRLELISFINVHTRRHIHQLKNIHEKLNEVS